MKTILYISYDGMTDNLGQAQVIPYLVGLRKRGYAIHILSCEKPVVFAHKKATIEKLLSKNQITWHPISYTAKPAIVSTMYDMHCLQNKACEIVKKHSVDLVHCRSYIAASVGVYLNKKYKLPWIFDMRGFWADERIDGKIWDTKKFIFRTIYKHFKQLETKYISNASHIITLTHAGKKEMLTWKIFNLCSTPISVIPCCADLDLFDYKRQSQQKKQAMRKELNIANDTFVISYLGSFGTWYMNNEMFDFFAQLHRSNSNTCFLCITPDNKDMLYDLAEKHNIPKTALRIVKANRNEVPQYASISNWSLFFIKPLYSKIASSPTKMGELLGLGIPLVCNANVGDVEEIMQNCSQGACIHDFSSETFQHTIDYILKNPNVAPETLHAVAQQFYSLEHGVEAYAQVYADILC